MRMPCSVSDREAGKTGVGFEVGSVEAGKAEGADGVRATEADLGSEIVSVSCSSVESSAG